MNKSRNTHNEGTDTIEPRDRDVYFEKGIDFEVPYTKENISRCMCSQCPVQADSKCVKGKLESSKKEMEELPAGQVPNPENIPGLYCSTGEARCQDLSSDRQCICNTCKVWEEYALEKGMPSQYFCKSGRAK
jgi:hypothetical protein